MPHKPYSHLSERERFIIIVNVLYNHMTVVDVADKAGVSRQTVYNVIEKWNNTGHLEEEKSTGRIPSYNQKNMNKLRRLILQHANATSDELLELMGEDAPRVSNRTIERYRLSLGFTPRRTQPYVYLTDEQKAAIHQFAVQHQHKDMKQWLYIDECTVQLRDTGDIVWILRGQPTPPHPVSSLRAALHVWGAIWWNGRSFTRYKGHLNADMYIQLLAKHLLPHRNETSHRPIAEDNASYHRAQAVQQWFQNQGLRLIPYPPYAKEFNGIEYCWGG
jgi:transposase